MSLLSWFRRRPVPPRVEPVDPPREALEAVREQARYAACIDGCPACRATLGGLDDPTPTRPVYPRLPRWTYDFGNDPSSGVAADLAALEGDQMRMLQDVSRVLGWSDLPPARAPQPPRWHDTACGCPECAVDPLVETSFEVSAKDVDAIERVWLDALAVEVDVLGRSPWDAASRVFGGGGVTRDASGTGLSATLAGEPAESVHG